MCDTITFSSLREIICDLADVMQANADYLTRLDVAVGDGDHGRNMALGFRYVREEIEALPPTAPGFVLRAAGMTLVTTVGGASGPLYGAAFIAAGISAGAKEDITLADLYRMTQAAADGLARRGRCRLGDKTILDALAPAVDALSRAVDENCTLLEGLEAAARAAHEGMELTIPLVAHRGIAMQYGQAAAGHLDPGATSCCLMFESAVSTLRRLCTHSEQIEPFDTQP